MRKAKNLRIGIDIDGTVTMLKEYMQEKGREYFQKEVVNTETYLVTRMFDVSEEEANEFCWGLEEEYLRNAPKRSGFYEFIEEVAKHGDTFMFITSRFTSIKKWYPSYNEVSMVKVTKEYFKDLTKYEGYEGIYFTGERKGRICKGLKLNVHIDDSQKVKKEVENYGIPVLRMGDSEDCKVCNFYDVINILY